MIPSKKLIEKYNQNLPRYTSYPPANFFTEQNSETFVKQIEESNNHSPQNISIYIHIPFCKQLCFYCGCNTNVYTNKSIISNYLEDLHKEISQVISLLDKSRKISQIHFGGGTPSILETKQISRIIDCFSNSFEFTPQAEVAIECNPANLDKTYINDLISIGFNRISIGVQDFDHKILQEVNRDLPKLSVEFLAAYIQSKGVKVNLDLMYGLPFQTIESFAQNIKKAIGIAPDRIVTFSYAHLPQIKPNQKLIDKKPMANAEEKLQMLHTSLDLFSQTEYTAIGLDHFAKKDDSLSIALKNKTLHRNFQGYCSRESTGQVYAFGASGITQLHNSFFQNIRSHKDYSNSIKTNNWAVQSGHILSKEEITTSRIIESILCNNYLNWDEIAQELNTTTQILKSNYKFALDNLSGFEEDGLISTTENTISVTNVGKSFLRNIAANFDPKIISSNKTFSSTI